MSNRHQIMDSSLALGRLEINSPTVNKGTRLSGSLTTENVQVGPQTHLNGCVPLSHQVAGHKYGVDKVGILQHPDGTVLKQLQPPPRGPREMQFYSMVYGEDCRDPCLLDLQKHLPKYYGTWSSADSSTDLYLKLEDVTRMFQNPCIMDVKIGQRSYDPFASQEKREQQIRKYPLMEEIGFLVLGMRVYKVSSNSYDTYDQHYGRGLGKDTIKDGLSKFFYNGNSLRKDAITASILKVEKILQWFEGQSQLHFYASSLLFVYEGLTPPAPAALALENPPENPSATNPCEPHEEVLEYNNNIHMALSQSLFAMYALHKRGCTKGHHSNAPAGDTEDNNDWKHTAQISSEQPNGNDIKAQLEKEARPREPDAKWTGCKVEVKMIDFAHVFPSKGQDEGYIYGLKNLLRVLQQILSE